MNLEKDSVFRTAVLVCLGILVLSGYLDLQRERVGEIEIVSLEDNHSTGWVDTVTLRVSGVEREKEVIFYSISDYKNSLPWKANVSRINSTSIVKISMDTPSFMIKEPGFRIRGVEKGRPESNTVSELETKFVCQPGIRDPYFEVWGESNKVKEPKVPSLWGLESKHNINYQDLDRGISTNGTGTVLKQRTDYIPEEIDFKAKGDMNLVIHDSGRKVYSESFSGSVNRELDFRSFPRKGEYVVEIVAKNKILEVYQIGDGECRN